MENFQNLASELEMLLVSVHNTEHFENCLSDFDKGFQTIALLEPVAQFMRFSFREDIEADSRVLQHCFSEVQGPWTVLELTH